MTADYRWGACSEVGLVRQVNEDSKCHEPPLFAVADGMGGHSAGDVASALAIKELIAELKRSDSIGEAVHAANRAIYQKALANPKLAGMGTTITALYGNHASAHIAHVGDSRAYLLRTGSLSRLTQDHTVVSRLVQQGRLMPEDADRHPQRSYLERALGVDAQVEVDVHVLELFPGDRVLLCSDGLFGMIDDGLIQQVMETEHDPQRAAERLCEEAIHAGGADNVTTIVIDVPERPGGSGSPNTLSRLATMPAGRTDTGPMPDPPNRRAASSPGSGLAGEPQTWGPGGCGLAGEPQTWGLSPGARRFGGPSGRARGLLWVTALVVVLGGSAAGVNAWLSSSWYVGIEGGRVTVFNGVKGSIAGYQLFQLDHKSQLAAESLPELNQVRLKQGIPAGSRAEALLVVRNLEDKVAPEIEPETSVEPAPSLSPPAT
ncbi:MAG: Stp1/IreP family PP2C-type Ser/Thr phosphatase [Actinomycetota bacterium]